jgi:hypothetical protein
MRSGRWLLLHVVTACAVLVGATACDVGGLFPYRVIKTQLEPQSVGLPGGGAIPWSSMST